MKKLSDLGSDSSYKADINMSPLIDMVFLLLIFFMVTTVFVEETGIEVNKPSASSASDLEKKSILIAVSKDGKIVYAGQEMSLNSVRGLVSRLLQDKNQPVIIIADKDASAGLLVDVIDECKLAGAKQVNIGAEME